MHLSLGLPRPSSHGRSAFDHLVPVPGLLLQTGLRDAQQHGQSLVETSSDTGPDAAADSLKAAAARLEQDTTQATVAALVHGPADVP